MTKAPLIPFLFCAGALCAQADPQLSCWITQYSGKYGRIYENEAALLSGSSVTTWTSTNGMLTQAAPAYVGVQTIQYSADWIYITTSGFGPYTMGPWYNDATRTGQFINLPVNQKVIYAIPRTSTLGTPPATKMVTEGQNAAIGYFVDGVAMYDPTDGFTYANGAEASPGTGVWHRDAYVNEAITFDPGNSHQQNTGQYHNHADPLALRYLVGDHVDYNAAAGTYSEDLSAPTKHSPILGWLRDGLPVYGPYGYSSPMDPTSGIRRMVGGFCLRDGSTPGVDDIVTAGRTLPEWAIRNGSTESAGPAVSTTYPLGRYIEDWAYLGDLIKSGTTPYQLGTDFDLDEYNVRYCVTPEFPNGTYAYFLNVSSIGVPQFPYNTNRYFYQTATGGTTAITETTTTYFNGGPNITESAQVQNVDTASGDVSIEWSSVEGGSYKVEATPDLANWTTLTGTQAAASDAVETNYTDSGAALSNGKRFYRITRESLAAYDPDTGSSGTTGTQGIASVSPTSGTAGNTVSLTITLNNSYTPPPPPDTAAPTGATLTATGASTISAASYSRSSSTGVVTASFNIPSNATHTTYTVNAIFGSNTWSLTGGFTVN
ncbi:MAG TPA: YHYH protein [Chthoniobacteraceae bacterium]|jgi:hypothetical protein|nr:YHYH protein [Chthoniobacteraceae bacterium]